MKIVSGRLANAQKVGGKFQIEQCLLPLMSPEKMVSAAEWA